MKKYEKLLLAKRAKLLEEIDELRKESTDTIKNSTGDLSSYSYHMADVATDNYDREFSLGLASNERDILYEIDAALQKIDDGTFGQCEECERLISKTRLKAVPYAKLCIKCQEAREKKA